LIPLHTLSLHDALPIFASENPRTGARIEGSVIRDDQHLDRELCQAMVERSPLPPLVQALKDAPAGGHKEPPLIRHDPTNRIIRQDRKSTRLNSSHEWIS